METILQITAGNICFFVGQICLSGDGACLHKVTHIGWHTPEVGGVFDPRDGYSTANQHLQYVVWADTIKVAEIWAGPGVVVEYARRTE